MTDRDVRKLVPGSQKDESVLPGKVGEDTSGLRAAESYLLPLHRFPRSDDWPGGAAC